jgi:hypothetical protein
LFYRYLTDKELRRVVFENILTGSTGLTGYIITTKKKRFLGKIIVLKGDKI